MTETIRGKRKGEKANENGNYAKREIISFNIKL